MSTDSDVFAMRWFVDISQLGTKSEDGTSLCVEAPQWQPALQKARALHGDQSSLGSFSIELLDDGYRASDPVARRQYVVRRAPDDAPLSVAGASGASGPSGGSGAGPAKSVPPPKAESIPPAKVEVAKSVPPPKAESIPPPKVEVAKSVPPPKAEPAVAPSSTPSASAAASIAPLASPKAVTVSVKDPLPSFVIVSSRSDEPTADSPLTYREFVYAVPPATPEEDARRLIFDRFESLRADLGERTGRFFNLAIFDHAFEGRPQRRPIVTLTWKDWKSPDPEVRHPLRERVSMPPPTVSVMPPAPTADSKAAQIAKVEAANREAARQEAEKEAAAKAEAARIEAAKIEAEKQAAAKAEAARIEAAKIEAAKKEAEKAEAAKQEAAKAEAAKKEAEKAEAARIESAKIEAEKQAAAKAEAAKQEAAKAEAAKQEAAKAEAAKAEAAKKEAAKAEAAKQEAAKAEAAKKQAAKADAAKKPEQAKKAAAKAEPAKSERPREAAKSTPPKAVRLTGDDLLTELFEAFGDLQFARDALEGAEFVLRLTLEKLPSEVALVSLFDMNTREFVIVRQSGGPRSALCARQPERAPLALQAMRKHQAIVINDPDEAASAMDDRWWAIGTELKSFICAPVELSGRYLGLIEIANPSDERAYDDGDGNALTYIGQQFAEFVAQRGVIVDPATIRGDDKPPPTSLRAARPLAGDGSGKRAR